MKKLIAGVFISAIFVYLSLRGIKYQELIKGLGDARYFFLIPSATLLFSISLLRSVRWGIILSPVEKVGQKKLFPITCIGYLAIVMVPMRLGELVRPYLLSDKSKIPMSTALATIFVERVLDSMILCCMLFFVFFRTHLPAWVLKTGYSSLIALVILSLSMLFLYFNTKFTIKILHPVLKRLPQRFQIRIEDFIQRFLEGFKIIGSLQKLFYAIIFTISIWILSGLAIYSLFTFHNFQLPFISAFIVLVFIIISTSIPAAPGMVGNFQFACIVALSLFNLNKEDAFIFSMVYYCLGMGIQIFLGLIFLPSMRLSLKETVRDIKNSFN
ncbi:lysylphosphatidylglycerol synthase transmembrane domain-containing protein [Thermodesulfobacteriota bacterium]